MSVHPTAKNLTLDMLRRLSKQQPKRPRLNRDGFSAHVEDIVMVRSGGVCELDACGTGEVLHHRRPRGSGGTRLEWVNRAANALLLSNHCHLRVEGRLPDSSRHWSKVRGWLVSQNGYLVATDVAVFYRGRWVLLADNGDIREVGDDGGVLPVGGEA